MKQITTNRALVSIVDGMTVTSSTEVAKHFDKKHRDVGQRIRHLCSQLPQEGLRYFTQTSYLDSQGRPQTCFNMTRDGFSLLAMGFTGEKALQFKIDFIDAFNQYEAAFKLAPGEVKVSANDLNVFQKYGRDLIAMQRRCLKQAGQIERFLRQQIRRLSAVPVKMSVAANQMELPL